MEYTQLLTTMVIQMGMALATIVTNVCLQKENSNS